MVWLSPVAHWIQVITGVTGALLILWLLIFQPGLQQPANQLAQIKQHGYLRALTLNRDVGRANGFEYQLVRWFSESIGVKADFIPVSRLADLETELLFSSGDIIAAGLSQGESRYRSALRYGPAYYQVKSQVIYRNGHVKRPKKLQDIVSTSLYLIEGSGQSHLLQRLKQQQSKLTWTAVDMTPEALIEQVDIRQVDYMLADSHIIALQRRFFPELRIAFTLGQPRQLRWAFRQEVDDDSLADAIEIFFKQINDDGRLDQLIHRHYDHVDNFNYSDIQTFNQLRQTRLPKYIGLFRQEAEDLDMDWRLLAAIGYQESLWNPRAKSPTGVRGLMMLTQTTAKQMKVTNRLDPQQSIRGGARYFKRIHRRIPERIAEPDRSWFALAAYNVGFGHMEDARILTEVNGGDPDKWIDVKKSLPLLADKAWYENTKHGYARGWEPVKYVENVRQYYEYLIGNEIKPDSQSENLRSGKTAAMAPSL